MAVIDPEDPTVIVLFALRSTPSSVVEVTFPLIITVFPSFALIPSPPAVMLPVSDTITVFVPTPEGSIPRSVPVVVKAPVTVTVSPVFIVLPSLVVLPDAMVKSSAITGAARARQTKADVPSRKLLGYFKSTGLDWGIGCMASVLEEEFQGNYLQ